MLETWTAEQREIQRTFREFAVRELLPGARERDRSAAFPADLIGRLVQLGGMGITVPVGYGGLGLDSATQLIAIEEVAYGDAALASIHTAHYLAMEPLLLYGSDEQRERFLAPLARGDCLGAFALTEPEAGSDIGSMKTIAARQEGGWKISGTKTYISNAAEAGIIILFAKTDPNQSFRGISAFALDPHSEGVSFSPPQEKLGIRSAPTYTIYLEDVAVSDDAVIGAPGEGGRIALAALNRARIDIAAVANGIAMRALQLATEFASNRVQFGEPIRSFQAVQLLLGEMDAGTQAARVTTFWAAGLKDGGHDLRRAASVAKYIATENCFSVVDKAVQIHGGAGYMAESDIQRLYRDCRILRIYEGTSQIQLLTIARELAGQFDKRGAVV
jgi:alkylation response protein AidB-like acyl-CoA dehydrogenase